MCSPILNLNIAFKAINKSISVILFRQLRGNVSFLLAIYLKVWIEVGMSILLHFIIFHSAYSQKIRHPPLFPVFPWNFSH